MIELTSIQLEKLKKWENETYCLEAVKQDGYALQYVKEQSEAVCMEAVKQNGDALRYVKEQTEAICLEAMRQNPEAYVLIDKKIYTGGCSPKKSKEKFVERIEV